MGVDRLLGFDSQMLMSTFVQLAVTAILFFIVGKYLYEPVKKFLKDREESVAKNISDAENSLAKANELKAMYEEKLAKIEGERTSILEEARKIAKEKEQDIINEAKEEATVIKNRAMTEIKQEQEKAKDDMKTQIIEISSLIAKRFVSANMDQDTQNKLFTEATEDLEEVKWLN